MVNAIPEIDVEKCTGCGDCASACPGEAVDIVQGKAVVVRPEDCDYCTECEVLCPLGAISCPFEIVMDEK